MKVNSLKLIAVAFVAILLFSFAGYAQKVNWGKPFSAKSKWYEPNVLDEDDNSFYVAAKEKGKISLEKYEKVSKKKLFDKEIEVPKKHRIERIIYTNNRFLVFFSYYDKKNDLNVIYANSYSSSDGAQIKKDVEILSVPVEKRRRKGDFDVYKSKDAKRILVNHDAYYKKQKKYRSRYILFDSELKKLTEKEDAIDNSEAKQYNVVGMTIDLEGSFYFMKQYKDGSYKNTFSSYDANKDYEKWEETLDIGKLGLPPKSSIYNTSFTINKKGDFILAGYYSRENKSLDGCFFMRIDHKSKEIVVKKVTEFDKTFKDQFLTEKQMKKGKDAKIALNFGKMDLYLKDDGGTVGIGEFYIYIPLYDRNGNLRSEQYYYLDLISVNFSEDGTLIWANRIPKSQKFVWVSYSIFIFSTNGFGLLIPNSKTTDYMSYFAGLSKDKLYIAYNDRPENSNNNSDQAKLKPFKKPQKAVLSLFTIDLKTGKKEKGMFLDGKDFMVTSEPATAYQKNQNSDIILLGSRKKTFKFGTMSFTKK